MAFYDTKELLKTIQTDDPDVVYRDVCRKAAEWALCGYMSEANRLLDILWEHDHEHFDRDPRLNRGFQVMWEVSGSNPQTPIPFELGDVEQIEEDNLDYFLLPYGGQPAIADLEKPLHETPTDSLFVKAVFFYGTQQTAVLEIISALKKFIHESKYATGFTHFQSTSFGCLLAAELGDKQQLLQFIRLWVTGYQKVPSRYSASVLMSNRFIARLLLSGALIDLLHVDRSECETVLTLISAGLRQRSSEGRALIYGDLSWLELLERISEKSIQQNDLDFSDDIVARQWLGFDPASMEDIRLKETALGVSFPSDYVDFLSVSNGFRACQYEVPTLCTIHEVGFLKDLDPGIIDLYDPEVDGEVVTQSIRNSILIGGLRDEQQLLLGTVEDGQWVCWFYSSSGEWQFQSLRYFMEYQLRTLEENESTT